MGTDANPAGCWWTIDTTGADGIVRIATHGPMGREDLVRMIRESLARANEAQRARFLVDHRDMRPLVGAAEIYDLPRISQREGLDSSLRIAILYPVDSPHRGDFEFYQMMSWSIGADHIRLFTETDAALEWLQDGA